MPSLARFADVPRRGPAAASAEEVGRLMRRVGYAGALVVAWALAGTVASLASGAMDGVSLALAGGLPAALVALVAWLADRRRPTPARSAVAALAATLAVAFALAGHALFWRGPNEALFLLTLSPALRAGVFAGALLLVPLYAGARLLALELAWSASGSRARSPRLTWEALARPGDDLLAAPAWRRAWRTLLARWVEGARLPGLMLMDAAKRATLAVDRFHAESSSEELAKALSALGVACEKRGRELHVKLADGSALRVSSSRTLLPQGPCLEVRGDVDAARRLRRLLEGPAGHALVFAWSSPARRWERRLNALHREALVASSLAERSLVMEELDRVRSAIAERSLCGEESTILSLKEESIRAHLAHRMLSEPPGHAGSSRVLSMHGALVPQVARVVDAGGLSAVKRVAFVPHWVVPVASPWGEQEVVVCAATGKLDRAESRALLDAMGRRGPMLFLDVGPQAAFLPAAGPTGALLREARAAGLVVSDDVAKGLTPVDIIYVPYLATADGYVSGITGQPATDLGPAVPVAASA